MERLARRLEVALTALPQQQEISNRNHQEVRHIASRISGQLCHKERQNSVQDWGQRGTRGAGVHRAGRNHQERKFEVQERRKLVQDYQEPHVRIQEYSQILQEKRFEAQEHRRPNQKYQKVSPRFQDCFQDFARTTQHVNQPSIYLQESKNKFASYTKEKTKESQLENFQIENLEDKIEEQDLENADLEMVTSEEKSNEEDKKEVSNTEQKSNKNKNRVRRLRVNWVIR